jgi:alpha-amylase/alpha-mannosidase (GH57 family)
MNIYNLLIRKSYHINNAKTIKKLQKNALKKNILFDYYKTQNPQCLLRAKY